MNGTSDTDLVRRWARYGDETAFAELVARHCNLVWATARRVSGDPEAARDVTQTVFSILARKAPGFTSGTVLAGWLHRTARLEAAKHIRRETRRTRREFIAMKDQDSAVPPAEPTPESAQAIAGLQQLLDEALSELGEDDRHAVVLRYLSGRSLAEIGASLGSSEDAAQKRVSRALEKLRGWFRSRGVFVGDGVVAAALGLAGAEAAPAGLASAIAGTAAAGAAVSSVVPLLNITLMNTKLALGTVVAVATAGLLWQQNRIHQLTGELAALRQQPPEPPTTPPGNRPDPSRSEEEHAELLRLRGEVAQLRQRPDRGTPASEQDAARIRQAEARTAALREEVIFRQRRAALIEGGKRLGMAVRIFANAHQNRPPASWKELTDSLREMGLTESEADPLPSEVSPETYEFVPDALADGLNGPPVLMFREREPRRIPDAVLKEEDLKPGTPFAMPLRKGWERCYVMSDGSVQTPSSPDGDFAALERDLVAPATRP